MVQSDHVKDNLMLWQRIKDKLATRYPNLDDRVDLLHQVPAVKARATGRQWTDREVFEALILSILSNSTDGSDPTGAPFSLR